MRKPSSGELLDAIRGGLMRCVSLVDAVDSALRTPWICWVQGKYDETSSGRILAYTSKDAAKAYVKIHGCHLVGNGKVVVRRCSPDEFERFSFAELRE